MKYEKNKIVYEVGDYVIVSEHKDTPCRYFRDDTLCKCAEKNYYSPLDKSSIVSDWGGTERFNVTNRRGNDRQLRPATQEEINKATEEEKIMVGEYEAEFITVDKNYGCHCIKVGCVSVSKELFLKIQKKARWLE